MKYQFALKSILTMTFMFLGISLSAQEVSVTIHVQSPGTISSYISSSKRDLITKLTVTGNLNGTDIVYIRAMAGSDYHGYGTSGSLSVLDLSGANIVKGGDSYCDFNYSAQYKYTSDNAVGEFMFATCYQLTSITLPNSATSIATFAFYECTGLKSVTIGSSVQLIDSYAFYKCTELTIVNIPSSVQTIGVNAFNSCSGLKEFQVSEGNKTYCQSDGVLYNLNKTTLVLFPTAKPNSYTIPNSVTSISSFAFYQCSEIQSVTIPNSVITIGAYAFTGCSGLTSLTIPNSVTSIDSFAFYNCNRLTSLSLSNSLTSISSYAFSMCTGLTSVTIPECITSIGKEAFSWCSGLSSVTIPNSVTSIGASVFSSCTGLTSVTIGSGVKSIDRSAFNKCSELEKFQVSNGNTKFRELEGVLFNYDYTTLIKFPYAKSTTYSIPNSVTLIGPVAFSGCTGLTSVTIPNSVTAIDFSAFSYCSGLTSLTIPNSVTAIATFAFSGCKGLKTIHNNSTIPQMLSKDAMYTIDKATCKLYVPIGSYTAYWVAAEWGDFANIIEEDVTYVSETKAGSVVVYTEKDAIVIKGAESGEQIFVYTDSGAILTSTKATEDAVRINVPSGHIYLISVAGKTFKVAL